MSIPDFQSLMLPVLRRLPERRWRTSELVEAMAEEHSLTDAERKALLPSGAQTTIANRTYWVLVHLTKAGLATRVARGEYEISARGSELLKEAPDRITVPFLHRYPEYATFRATVVKNERVSSTNNGERQSSELAESTPQERLEAAHSALEAELIANLSARLQALSPQVFEQLIIDVLVRMGYGGSKAEAAQRLGRSGDGGVDGVIRQDLLGLDMIYVQAKRYAADNAVGAPAIQAFAGALLGHGATKGVLVTTARFTEQAR